MTEETPFGITIFGPNASTDDEINNLADKELAKYCMLEREMYKKLYPELFIYFQ